jgi:hypothetical protein
MVLLQSMKKELMIWEKFFLMHCVCDKVKTLFTIENQRMQSLEN